MTRADFDTASPAAATAAAVPSLSGLSSSTGESETIFFSNTSTYPEFLDSNSDLHTCLSHRASLPAAKALLQPCLHLCSLDIHRNNSNISNRRTKDTDRQRLVATVLLRRSRADTRDRPRRRLTGRTEAVRIQARHPHTSRAHTSNNSNHTAVRRLTRISSTLHLRSRDTAATFVTLLRDFRATHLEDERLTCDLFRAAHLQEAHHPASSNMAVLRATHRRARRPASSTALPHR